MTTLVQVLQVMSVAACVVVVLDAAPNPKPAPHPGVARFTAVHQGNESPRSLLPNPVREERDAGVVSTSHSRKELPPLAVHGSKKIRLKQKSLRDTSSGTPVRREALEVSVGTGIRVHIPKGSGITQRPYSAPKGPSYVYVSTDKPPTTGRPIVFPEIWTAAPRPLPTPPIQRAPPKGQSPPTIFHKPLFPGHLFPGSGFSSTTPRTQFPRPSRPPSYVPPFTTRNVTKQNFPRPSRPKATTRRPNYGILTTTTTTEKPCECQSQTSTPPPNSSPLLPKPSSDTLRSTTPSPGTFHTNFRPNINPFLGPSSGGARPATTAPGGFGPTLPPTLNQIPSFPIFQNVQPFLFVPDLRPQFLNINPQFPASNGISQFPPNLSNNQLFPDAAG